MLNENQGLGHTEPGKKDAIPGAAGKPLFTLGPPLWHPTGPSASSATANQDQSIKKDSQNAVIPNFNGSLEQRYAWMRHKQAQKKAQKRDQGQPVKQPKDTARYSVQVVYFGEIDKDLEALLRTMAKRPASQSGHSVERRRDLFWPCYDRSEAAELSARIGREVTVDADNFRCMVKTEEQYWDEKIKAAVGNGVAR